MKLPAPRRHPASHPTGLPRLRLSRNDAVAARGSCDASSQNVGATPSSREKPGARFGLAAGSGDEASPSPSATGASQRLAPQLRFSTASFRLRDIERCHKSYHDLVSQKMLGRHVIGEKRWRATAVQDASRSRKPRPFAPASWTAPAPWRFGPGQATCTRVA
jgi:hypothetical protein